MIFFFFAVKILSSSKENFKRTLNRNIDRLFFITVTIIRVK